MPTADLLLTIAHRLSIAMHEELGNEELGFEGVSPMGLLLMRALAASPDARSPRTLAATLGCSRSSTCELIDRLERDGFAQRTVDPHDRRMKQVALTEKGRAMEKEASEALGRVMRSFTDAFEEEDREKLELLLERLERGADWHRTMWLWRTYACSTREQRRRPALHIR